MANVDLETGEILKSAEVVRQAREDMSDDEYASMLLNEYDHAVRAAGEAYENRDRLKRLIYQYMDERGANGIPSDTFECVRSNSYAYKDKQKDWLPLFDIFNSEDLDKCYTPPAPGSGNWNTAQVKKFADRYGTAATEVVERSRTLDTKLTFTRKEKRTPEQVAQQWEGLNKE
jgi:hypothetical protein